MIRKASIDLAKGATARALTLARPERKNALSRDLVTALLEEVGRAEREPEVRAVIIAAEGDVFAAGGDLAEIARALEAPDGAGEVIAIGRELQRLEASALPVLVALSGDVYGGGCELILLADMVIAEAHARLSFRHARMGLAPAWGATARLIARAGPTIAARVLMTAESIDAAAARDARLVTEVVATGSSLARCVEIAEQIARSSREVIAAHKQGLQAALSLDRERSAALEEAVFRGLFGGQSHRDALAAFSERTRQA